MFQGMASLQEDRNFDVIVVGAGITGAGIARDAALRGLRVAVVEWHDIASGTSSRSTKLVHGGLRYLEMYDFHLVYEAAHERALLMRLAPHLVVPTDFVLPVYRDRTRHKYPLWYLNMGLWVYDALGGFMASKLHRRVDDMAGDEAVLKDSGYSGGLVYEDCRTDDARLTLENVIHAHMLGAQIYTGWQVTEVTRGKNGTVTGIVARNADGSTMELAAPVVINATGIWTDRLPGMSRKLVTPSRGSHISFRRERIPVKNAHLLMASDGRPVFIIPWHERVYVGTTDVAHEGELHDPVPERSEIDYLLEELKWYLKDPPDRRDIVGVWSGIRPLITVSQAKGKDPSKISRTERIFDHSGGFLSITGGKLTTFRVMAKKVLDKAEKHLRKAGIEPGPCITDKVPFPGAPDDSPAALSDGMFSEKQAKIMRSLYGSRLGNLLRDIGEDGTEPMVPGLDYPMACVDIAVRHEFARHVDDVVTRRTPVALKDLPGTLKRLDAIAARMARLLDWDSETESRELDMARNRLSRLWDAVKHTD